MEERKIRMLMIYKQALNLYKQRKFKEALEKFEECLRIDPEDGPSKVYVERCQYFLQNPPPDDWDGVFELKTK